MALDRLQEYSDDLFLHIKSVQDSVEVRYKQYRHIKEVLDSYASAIEILQAAGELEWDTITINTIENKDETYIDINADIQCDAIECTGLTSTGDVVISGEHNLSIGNMLTVDEDTTLKGDVQILRTLLVDVITEKTNNTGTTIEGVLLKDSKISAGTAPPTTGDINATTLVVKTTLDVQSGGNLKSNNIIPSSGTVIDAQATTVTLGPLGTKTTINSTGLATVKISTLELGVSTEGTNVNIKEAKDNLTTVGIASANYTILDSDRVLVVSDSTTFGNTKLIIGNPSEDKIGKTTWIHNESVNDVLLTTLTYNGSYTINNKVIGEAKDGVIIPDRSYIKVICITSTSYIAHLLSETKLTTYEDPGEGV